jgi:hypothetical protein
LHVLSAENVATTVAVAPVGTVRVVEPMSLRDVLVVDFGVSPTVAPNASAAPVPVSPGSPLSPLSPFGPSGPGVS